MKMLQKPQPPSGWVIGSAKGFQPLKSPTSATCEALGAQTVKRTPCTPFWVSTCAPSNWSGRTRSALFSLERYSPVSGSVKVMDTA